MSDENSVQNGAAEEPQDEKIETQRALVGIIVRRSADIREEVSLRIHNGKTYPEILDWLNKLPIVKEILAAQFDGSAINERNLSSWRKIGYQRWRTEKETPNPWRMTPNTPP